MDHLSDRDPIQSKRPSAHERADAHFQPRRPVAWSRLTAKARISASVSGPEAQMISTSYSKNSRYRPVLKSS